ncbi:MAG: 3-hydroxyacyl-[acyl-carrier-protein] dehydratase FabZ [Legionellales bacterium]|nr:3-hydroxyacyl-[acyl-carrier-protein] dehydratase FabZ [Legionellales bacterium]|tara:strand:- start:1399 stop:1833 length:435 start_codon:yes stop_codon:yes gene_type:complete
MIDIEKIKTLLPHRYPFLLIDRVIEVEKGKSIKALKNVSINEPSFQGHFPAKAVMPGVLIIEALTQAAGLLGLLGLEEGISEDSLFYLVGVDKVRIRKPVVPGDQLILDVKLISVRRNIFKFNGSAYVDSQLITSAELLTTVIT